MGRISGFVSSSLGATFKEKKALKSGSGVFGLSPQLEFGFKATGAAQRRRASKAVVDRVTQSMMRESFFPKLVPLLNALHADYGGRIEVLPVTRKAQRLFLVVKHDEQPSDPLVFDRVIDLLGARANQHFSDDKRARYVIIENYGDLEKDFGKGELVKFIKSFKPQLSLFARKKQ
jgi:hypothetical protein